MRIILIVWACLLIAGCGGQQTTDETAGPGVDVDMGDQAGDTDNGDTDNGDTDNGDTDNGDYDRDASDSNELGGDGQLSPVAMESGVATLTPDNTTIQFVGTHVGEPNPRTGVFTDFAGQVEIDPATNTPQRVFVEIQTASLETPIEKLTNHLRSPDFFDAREHPTATFESTSLEPVAGESGKYTMSGNLTLLQTTDEISFPVRVDTAAGGLTLSGQATVDRIQFGMDGMQDRVSNEVALTVTVGRKTVVPQGGR